MNKHKVVSLNLPVSVTQEEIVGDLSIGVFILANSVISKKYKLIYSRHGKLNT